MIIGFLFLIIDIRIGTIAFPAFEEFRAEAPETVEMVIGHVVTDHMLVDVVSDIAAFVLIAVAGGMIAKAGGKISQDGLTPDQDSRRLPKAGRKGAEDSEMLSKAGRKGAEDSEMLPKAGRKGVKLCVVSMIGIVSYLAVNLMPFVLNGRERYSAGYLLFFVFLAFKTAVLVMTAKTLTEPLENLQTHIYVNTTTIFLLIAVGCFVVSRVVFFYDLMPGYWIYFGLSIVFMLLGLIRVVKVLVTK